MRMGRSGTRTGAAAERSMCFCCRQDATKVDQGVPLRENWALPYFSCQVVALTGFLTNNLGSASEVGLLRPRLLQEEGAGPANTVSMQMFCYLTMSATTFTFLLFWEHGHYVLFVQGLCLFLLDSLDLVPHRKVRSGPDRVSDRTKGHMLKEIS